jgi:hypothetical protein
VSSPVPLTHTKATVVALADALHAEARLLSDLAAVMRRQRDAVTHDDLAGIDDSVYATHRILVTLGEARRHRRSLNRVLGESDELSIAALDGYFSGDVPADIRGASDQLSETARVLHREVEVNRRVLREAIESGSRYVRSLCGAPEASPIGYATAPGVAQAGYILDRRI